MTTQHDKSKRWRPRFAVRTLVIVVTLVCVYLGCWVETTKYGKAYAEASAGPILRTFLIHGT